MVITSWPLVCGEAAWFSYNLGPGTASVSSNPLDLSHGIHTVHLGRHFQVGWLKVKTHHSICPTILLSAAEGERKMGQAARPMKCTDLAHKTEHWGVTAARWCGGKPEDD